MNIIRLTFYWWQVVASALVTVILGLVPFVRCILCHSDRFYSSCFLALILIGAVLLRLSIKELREALKSNRA